MGQYTGTSVARVMVLNRAMVVALVAEYQNLNSDTISTSRHR